MKTKVLSFFVLLFILHQAQAQVKGNADYLVKYDVEFILDSTNRENVTREVHRLYTGATTSYYISEGTVFRDSLISAMRSQSMSSMRAMGGLNFQNMPRSEFHSVVFKDLVNSEVWVKGQISRDSYHYIEPNSPVEWELTDETKQIGQYTAIKATTSYVGRDYEAWFTFEVPILDGPYVFSGLPGLILELYDTDKDYQFYLSSLNPMKEKYLIDLKKGNSKLISKDDFVKSYKRNQENPMSSRGRTTLSNVQFTDRSGRTVTSKDMERRAKEAAAKRNNLIEIW